MVNEPRIVSFTIDEPFDVAVRQLRRALEREGLRIAAEVDISTRLREQLGVGLGESRILYVDVPILLLQATVFTFAGSLYMPEPVALSGSGKETRIAMRSIRPVLDEAFPASVRQAILQLHERIVKAIQSIGQREPALRSVTECPIPGLRS